MYCLIADLAKVGSFLLHPVQGGKTVTVFISDIQFQVWELNQ